MYQKNQKTETLTDNELENLKRSQAQSKTTRSHGNDKEDGNQNLQSNLSVV